MEQLATNARLKSCDHCASKKISILCQYYDPQAIPRKGVLFVNVKSRRGVDWFEQIHNRLVAGGMQLSDARRIRDPHHLQIAIRDSIDAGAPLVIVGGGDGTFSSVAHLFARRQTVLGVLPLGTGNAFARDLHISETLDGACESILEGRVARVDMGRIGDREFVNLATVGLSTRIAENLDDRAKKKLGKTVYIASVLKALSSVKPFHVKLELPDQTAEFESLQVVIGNGRFHAGPFVVAPSASITGGWLSIYALASPNKSALLKLAVHMAFGGYINMADVRVFRAQSGELTTFESKRVTVDGEIAMSTPVRFAVVPGALRVAVPMSFPG